MVQDDTNVIFMDKNSNEIVRYSRDWNNNSVCANYWGTQKDSQKNHSCLFNNNTINILV